MLNKLVFLIKKNPSYLLFLGFNLLREKIFFKLFKNIGISLFPSLVTILITKRCNYHCKGCSSASPEFTKNFFKNKQKEISLSEIKKVIDEVAWFKPFIYLNGGEPTLRTDLVEIIKYVKQKKLVCALTSNASLLNENILKKLIQIKLDFLSVSIDGPKEFHDKVRGVNGAYDRAINSLKIIKIIKEKNKIDYPHVRLASIIYPENLENSKHIVEVVNKLKVDEIGFGLLMYYPEKILDLQKKFIKKYQTGGEEPIGLKIKDNDKFNFKEKTYLNFLDYVKKNSKIPVYFAYQNNQYEKYFDPQIFPSKKSSCFTPQNSLLIHPNGDLGICQGFKFGNINKGKILKQWNNQEIVKFRKKRAQTPFPACFRCNEGQILKLD